jgi:hypothetical protein
MLCSPPPQRDGKWRQLHSSLLSMARTLLCFHMEDYSTRSSWPHSAHRCEYAFKIGIEAFRCVLRKDHADNHRIEIDFGNWAHARRTEHTQLQ